MNRRHLAFLAAALLTPPCLAWAHAALSKASPPAGAILAVAPAEVDIIFTQATEPRFSTITLTGADGTRLDRDDTHVLGGDARHLAVSLKPLAAGSYKVTWQVTSVDTHKSTGSYSFTIKP